MGPKVAMTVAWYTWVIAYRHCRKLLSKFLSIEALAVVCLDHAEIAVAVCTIMSVLANVTSYLHQPGPRLYDLGFHAFPEIPHNSPYNSISDILTALPALLLLPYSILYLDRTRRYQCWTDFFRLVTVIYGIRSLTMCLTSLPGPAVHCGSLNIKDLAPPPTGLKDIVLRLGPLYGDYRPCGDLLFSGHAAFLTVSLCLWRKQNRWVRTSSLFKIAFPIYLLVMSMLAVAGRKHYTVDLALGIVIGYLVFSRFGSGWGFKGVDELEVVKSEDEVELLGKGGSSSVQRSPVEEV